jgi:hypothetical protein
MLNTCCNSSYKELAKQAVTRECLVSEQPVYGLIVDFRSRMFRYMRLTYSNRSYLDRAHSVRTAMKDLRTTGDTVTEKKNVFFAALVTIKKEVEMMQVKTCTYVFPSAVNCPYKKAKKEKQAAHTRVRLEELKKRIELYKTNMFDLEALKQCALALESYIMSELDSICAMYSGKEWMLGVGNYEVPSNIDKYESDRLCARLAKEGCYAILSEDFDVVMLFGADIMVKEVYKQFFVYISLKDTMTVFNSVSRKDVIHRCCIMGTDYNMGLKGVGPIKAKKIDDTKAKQLFEICLTAQSTKPKDFYEFFLLQP